MFQLAIALAGIERSLERQHSLADVLIMGQVRPTGREPRQDAACRFVNRCRHLDEPRPPRARLALAERVVLASPVVMRSAAATSERFDRNFFRSIFWKRHLPVLQLDEYLGPEPAKRC